MSFDIGTLALVVDLGDATTFERCEQVFRHCAREIEEDSSLWQKGRTCGR